MAEAVVRRTWAGIVLGVVIAVIGLVLAIGGVWLAVLGGSWYYLVTGVLMVLSGGLLISGRAAGMWLYLVIFAYTVVWALWESGADPWALVPRLVGPAVILALVALLSPLIGRRNGWGTAVLGAVGAMVFLAVVLWIAAASQPNRVLAALPAATHPPGAQAVGEDWPAWGGTQAGERFSTLAQITPANVGRLQRVWTAHTGDHPEGVGKGKYAWENTPIKVGDRLYMCSPLNVLIALDARTGREIWRYDPKVSAAAIPFSAWGRGVTYSAGARAGAQSLSPPAATAPPAAAGPAPTSARTARSISSRAWARSIPAWSPSPPRRWWCAGWS
jgi:quinoprotein glucose dehydrogenase